MTLRDVAEADGLAVHMQAQLADVLHRLHETVHVEAHRALVGLDAPGWLQRILPGKRGLDVAIAMPRPASALEEMSM